MAGKRLCSFTKFRGRQRETTNLSELQDSPAHHKASCTREKIKLLMSSAKHVYFREPYILESFAMLTENRLSSKVRPYAVRTHRELVLASLFFSK